MRLRVNMELDLEVPDGMDPMAAVKIYFIYHAKLSVETVMRHIRVVSAERMEPWEDGDGEGWNERPYGSPDES